jgi:hypothetical protein
MAQLTLHTHPPTPTQQQPIQSPLFRLGLTAGLTFTSPRSPPPALVAAARTSSRRAKAYGSAVLDGTSAVRAEEVVGPCSAREAGGHVGGIQDSADLGGHKVVGSIDREGLQISNQSGAASHRSKDS